MRLDGRTPDQMRPLSIERNLNKYAEGSVLITLGDTRLICTASIDTKVPQFLMNSGRGWITAEYAMLPRATAVRTVRESSTGKVQGRTQEIQRLIGRSMRAVVNLEMLGERTIWLDCDVLQADGGTRTTAITGAFVAMYDALAWLRDTEQIPEIPVRQFCAAISVGVINGETCLDLSYGEDADAEVDSNVVMTESGEFIEIQSTAEKVPFDRKRLDELLALSGRGICEIITLQKKALGLEA